MRTTTTTLLALAVLAAGCASSADDGPEVDAAAPDDQQEAPSEADVDPATNGARESDEPPDAEAEIRMFDFEPEVIELEAGQTVTWTNQDATRHTVTAGDPDEPTGAFDIFLEDRGSTATVTFDEPGEYRFFCQPHNFMTGTVVVTQ